MILLGRVVSPCSPFIKMVVYYIKRSFVLSRCDTHLTYCYLMNGKGVPRCVAFDSDLTVEHIQIECVDFAEVRQRHYDAGNQ